MLKSVYGLWIFRSCLTVNCNSTKKGQRRLACGWVYHKIPCEYKCCHILLKCHLPQYMLYMYNHHPLFLVQPIVHTRTLETRNHSGCTELTRSQTLLQKLKKTLIFRSEVTKLTSKLRVLFIKAFHDPVVSPPTSPMWRLIALGILIY